MMQQTFKEEHSPLHETFLFRKSITTGDKMSSIDVLLEKTSHWDKDERYMATNDLCSELSKDAKMDENVERRICAAVLKQLDDKSNDVQSVAVKCLAMLLRKVQPTQIGDICDKLCTLIVEGNSDLRDIYSIGLKTLISDVADSTGALVASKATGRLLHGINNSPATAVGDDVKKECLDNLSELLRRFGHHIAERDHEAVMDSAIRALGAGKPVVRKRAAVCLGALSVVSGDELLHRLMTLLLNRIDAPGCSTEDTRTCIASICIISRDVGHRLGRHLARIVPLFLRCCGDADDEDTQDDAHNEVRENCFPGLESFVLCCPREVAPFFPSILRASVVFMAYDPNFCGDAAEMDVEEEEYEEEYEEEWDQDGQDEGDDDSSWKVRKAAVRLVAAVLVARPELLPQIQEHCQAALVRRFQERVENVRLDVIACFHRLLQAVVASGGGALADPGLDLGAVSLVDAPPQQKRQRGLAAPLVEDAADIVAAAVRQLREGQGGNINAAALAGVIKTKCVVFAMLRVLTAALDRQGLQPHLSGLMELAVAGARDKHPALRLEALGFVHGVLDACGAAVAEQYVPALTPVLVEIASVGAGSGGRVAGAQDQDSARLVVEGLVVIQKVVAVCHCCNALADQVGPLCAAVLSRFECNDVDNAVKTGTMACVGFLVSSFGTEGGFDIPRVLDVLGRRLESEPMRAAALKTLVCIAQSPLHLDLSPCHSPVAGAGAASIVEMAVGYVRVSGRLLKHAAIQLLNALLLNSVAAASEGHAPSFPAAAVCAIAVAVAGCISDQDMYVCTQALQTVESIVTVARGLSLGDAPSVNEVLRAEVYQRLLELTVSPLLQGATLDHLVRGLRALVAFEAVSCQQVFEALCAKVGPSLAKQSVSCVSKCTVGVITASVDTTQAAVVHFTEKLSSGGGAAAGGDSVRLFALLCIGGLHSHVGASAAAAEEVAGLVLSCLTDSGSGSEDLKHTAAVTLGQLAASNAGAFLPLIVEGVRSSNNSAGSANTMVPVMNPLLYLYLVALRECVDGSVGASAQGCPPLVDTALPLLFTVMASSEESIRSIAAECLGLLMYTTMGNVSSSDHILKQLHQSLAAEPEGSVGSSTGKLLRWTVITALKCCFSRHVGSVPGVVINTDGVMELYLGLLKALVAALTAAGSVTTVVPEPILLSLLDCELCKSAVLFINASVHYNASVIMPYVSGCSSFVLYCRVLCLISAVCFVSLSLL